MSRILYLLFVITGLSACRKSTEINPGTDTAKNRSFTISIEQLPGATLHKTGLRAKVQISGSASIPVLNIETDLHYNGNYNTDTFSLPEGNYRLTGFWITDNEQVIYASPKTGSEKASLVSEGLDIPILLRGNSVRTFFTQVAAVDNGDKAEDFGYAPGAFINPDETDDELYRIKVRAVIKIGDIIYDSIPAKLTINTWFADGSELSSVRQLSPGTNDVLLHRKGDRHELILTKWNISDARILFPEDINEQVVYDLGSERAAKKLKEVLTYKSDNDVYVPLMKLVYEYSSAQQLSNIITYKKRMDGSTYIDETRQLNYQQNKVSEILHYTEEGLQKARTAFDYTSDGKIQKILHVEDGKETLATATYIPFPGNEASNKHYTISTALKYNYRSYSETQNLSIHGGMIVREFLATSHGSSAETNNGYDFNINPYAHLNLPDLHFSNLSIHNKNIQYSVYTAGQPETKPITFTYSYDSDGYPTEQIVFYNYVLSGNPAFSIKSIYKY